MNAVSESVLPAVPHVQNVKAGRRGSPHVRMAHRLARLAIMCAVGFVAPVQAAPVSSVPVQAAPAQVGEDLRIEGVAGLAERGDLPPKTQLIVEVMARDADRPLAEQRIDLDGRQPPVPFTLAIGRDRLAGTGPLVLRAAFLVEGQARFVSDPVPLSVKPGPMAVGELVLHPFQPLAFVTRLSCGARSARLGLSEGTLILELDGARHALRRAPQTQDTGAYVGIDSPLSVTIAEKTAIVTLADGVKLECRAAPEAGTRLTARGNEPFWHLTLGPDGVELTSLTPDLAFAASSVSRDEAARAPRWTASSGERHLVVHVSEKPCADSMTGMPFPVGVTVEIDGHRLKGCGGEIADVLAGEWQVIRMGDDRVPSSAPLTLSFGADGQISGFSGCNRFSGSSHLSGEGLSFGPLAATRMACAPEKMALEARMLGLLAKVTRATTGDSGKLLLMTPDAAALTLDRAH